MGSGKHKRKHKGGKEAAERADDKHGRHAAPDAAPEKLGRKRYDAELRELQAKVCMMQDWVRATGERIIVVFEGRDAAGKGGAIRALTERVSPRVFRVVALPAPSDREKSQLYMQRYLAHFPAAGEIVIFDRSWYNRAGVERVMGFCTDEQYHDFLGACPAVERHVTRQGIRLLKYWLEVGNEQQKERFEERIDDPLKQWKLSTMDLPSRERWYEYSRARDAMLDATDTEWAPWYLVDADDQKRARLNVLSHILATVPWKKVKRKKVALPDREATHAYDDVATVRDRRWIPGVF